MFLRCIESSRSRIKLCNYALINLSKFSVFTENLLNVSTFLIASVSSSFFSLDIVVEPWRDGLWPALQRELGVTCSEISPTSEATPTSDDQTKSCNAKQMTEATEKVNGLTDAVEKLVLKEEKSTALPSGSGSVGGTDVTENGLPTSTTAASAVDGPDGDTVANPFLSGLSRPSQDLAGQG